MAVMSLQRTVARLGRLVEPESHSALGDDALLQVFARSHSETAFAELVRRHGSMVLNVAHRVLGDRHAAEDVLQTTFLLLARKAGLIRWRRTAGPWLHSAAYRLACEARRRQARHPDSLGETPAEVACLMPPDRPLLWAEVRTAIDEELSRLPSALQAPLLLCYLQGLTRDEAAQRLGLTLATLKRRLEQGRRRLQGRLTCRGLALGTFLAALAASEEALSAEMSQAVARAAISVLSTGSSILLSLSGWRKFAAVGVLLAVAIGGWVAGAKPVPRAQPPEAPAATKPAKAPKTDMLGDPLPEGALARLGTTRLRPGRLISAVAFSPDGKQLATWTRAWGGGDGKDRLIFEDVTTGKELRTVLLPQCNLLAMRWLPDGHGLAVVKLSRGDYFVWDFTDERTALPMHEKPDLSRTMPGDLVVPAAAISPDGRRLVTGRSALNGSPQPVEVWDVTTNSPLKDLKSRQIGEQPGNGMHILVSPDGRRAFVINRLQPTKPFAPEPPGLPMDHSRLVVYDLAAGRSELEFEVPAVQAAMGSGSVVPTRLALDPDGKTLYVGDEHGTIHVYDWAASKELSSFTAHPVGDPLRFEPPGVEALAVSTDGRTLYSAGKYGGYSIWDLKAQPPTRKIFREFLSLNQFAFSPDATRLAVTTSSITGQVHVLDAKTGDDLCPQPGHAGMVLGLSLLPGGRVQTAGLDATVRQWHLETGREIGHQPVELLKTWLITGCFTADDRGLFGLSGGHVVHVDLASGKKTPVTTEPVKPTTIIHGVAGSSVFFNTDDGKVRQWDAAAGRVVRTFDPPRMPDGKSCGVIRAAMSPERRQVAFLSAAWRMSGQFGYRMGAYISLYDAHTGQLQKRWYTQDGDFQCCAYSPDGKYLLVGGMPTSGGPKAASTDPVLPISPKSGPVLFDTRTGEPIRAFDAGVTLPVDPPLTSFHRITALAISPSGALFAGAQMDGSVCVHELATGALCRTFRGHRSDVSQLAFSADGRRLISVSHDMTGLVWDTSFADLANPLADASRDRLFSDLAKPEWELAGPAMATLGSKPADLMVLVREQLKPAAGPDLDAEELKKLVQQLDDPLFAVRERASVALSRNGREALPLLQEHLGRATVPEQRQRLQKVIQTVARSPVPSEHLRQLRLLAMLEQNDSAEARTELKRLAGGHADAALTRDAQAALKRMP